MQRNMELEWIVWLIKLWNSFSTNTMITKQQYLHPFLITNFEIDVHKKDLGIIFSHLLDNNATSTKNCAWGSMIEKGHTR